MIRYNVERDRTQRCIGGPIKRVRTHGPMVVQKVDQVPTSADQHLVMSLV